MVRHGFSLAILPFTQRTPVAQNLPRSLKDIRNAIPAHLFVRHTKLGLLYTARDLVMAATIWYSATFIDPAFKESRVQSALTPYGAEALRWTFWAM